jgi:hypothetical protein
VTYRVLIFAVALRILLGDLSHNRIGYDITGASDEVNVGPIEELDQGI